MSSRFADVSIAVLRCNEEGQDSLLVYMPSRYYSYLIYAAVFALKAVRVRALIASEAQSAGDLVRRAVICLRIVAQVCPHPAAQYADLLDAYILRIELNLRDEDQAKAPSEALKSPIEADSHANPIVMPPLSESPFNFDFLNAPLFGESSCPVSGLDADAMGTTSFGEWASIIEHGMEGLPSLSALFS